jgi:orotate phosphoribosyltransferase
VVAGLVVALDRQEIAGGKDTVNTPEQLSAVQSVVKEYNFPVHSVASLADLLVYCEHKQEFKDDGVMASITAYREKFGCTQ